METISSTCHNVAIALFINSLHLMEKWFLRHQRHYSLWRIYLFSWWLSDKIPHVEMQTNTKVYVQMNWMAIAGNVYTEEDNITIKICTFWFIYINITKKNVLITRMHLNLTLYNIHGHHMSKKSLNFMFITAHNSKHNSVQMHICTIFSLLFTSR